MRQFFKEDISEKTHQVMLCKDKKILVGDVLQLEWDYFITIPFQKQFHGKSKKEFELLLRGFLHNLLTQLTTPSERKNGERLDTFSALQHLETNAHFHLAIRVPNHWKRIREQHNKYYFVRDKVKKVMVKQMGFIPEHIWNKKENEIFKPVNDPTGMFSYCVSENETLSQVIDTLNLHIKREVA